MSRGARTFLTAGPQSGAAARQPIHRWYLLFVINIDFFFLFFLIVIKVFLFYIVKVGKASGILDVEELLLSLLGFLVAEDP